MNKRTPVEQELDQLCDALNIASCLFRFGGIMLFAFGLGLATTQTQSWLLLCIPGIISYLGRDRLTRKIGHWYLRAHLKTKEERSYYGRFRSSRTGYHSLLPKPWQVWRD